ncbi:MAG: hypothetical protein AABY75_05420 [Bacteroidota bacterium]
MPVQPTDLPWLRAIEMSMNNARKIADERFKVQQLGDQFRQNQAENQYNRAQLAQTREVSDKTLGQAERLSTADRLQRAVDSARTARVSVFDKLLDYQKPQSSSGMGFDQRADLERLRAGFRGDLQEDRQKADFEKQQRGFGQGNLSREDWQRQQAELQELRDKATGERQEDRQRWVEMMRSALRNMSPQQVQAMANANSAEMNKNFMAKDMIGNPAGFIPDSELTPEQKKRRAYLFQQQRILDEYTKTAVAGMGQPGVVPQPPRPVPQPAPAPTPYREPGTNPPVSRPPSALASAPVTLPTSPESDLTQELELYMNPAITAEERHELLQMLTPAEKSRLATMRNQRINATGGK